jgi:hypothetical protein
VEALEVMNRSLGRTMERKKSLKGLRMLMTPAYLRDFSEVGMPRLFGSRWIWSKDGRFQVKPIATCLACVP